MCDILFLLINPIIFDVVHLALFHDVWVIRHTLRRLREYLEGWATFMTYSQDLVRQRLCSLLSLGEVGTRSVQLSSVQLLVKTSSDTKQLLVGSELIPSPMSR